MSSRAHLNQVDLHVGDTRAVRAAAVERVVEQLVRPTGILDPEITVRPTEGQIDDLMDRIRERVERGERVAGDDADQEDGRGPGRLPARDGRQGRVPALARSTRSSGSQILRDLRLGVYDVLVGINLLREGIDLPEVTLVAILDADKEGFLRSAWSLIQVMGRAARNVGGEVVMYADRVTESMQVAIEETKRRRVIQEEYNDEHGIVPQTIIKGIRDINDRLRAVAEATGAYGRGQARELSDMSKQEIAKLVAQLETDMKAAARELDFERAAALRDEIRDIRLRVLEEDASVVVGARRRPPRRPSWRRRPSGPRPSRPSAPRR